MTHSDEVTLNTYYSARRSRVLLLKYGATLIFISLSVEIYIKDKWEYISTGVKEHLFSTRSTRRIELTNSTPQKSCDQISWTQNLGSKKLFHAYIWSWGNKTDKVGVKWCLPLSSVSRISELRMTSFWVDDVPVVSRGKSKMDASVVSTVAYNCTHCVIAGVRKHENNICTGRRCKKPSVWLFNDTKRHQTAKKQSNAQLSAADDKWKSRVELWTRGCWGSSNL